MRIEQLGELARQDGPAPAAANDDVVEAFFRRAGRVVARSSFCSAPALGPVFARLAARVALAAAKFSIAELTRRCQVTYRPPTAFDDLRRRLRNAAGMAMLGGLLVRETLRGADDAVCH
jgi:hypothetical protein